MGLKIDREEFLRQLQMVRPGLSNQELIQQSDCFVLHKGRLITFNDEIHCSVPCPVAETITGAIPAATLLAVLGKIKDDELNVEAEDEGLVLVGKRKRIRIRRNQNIELQIDSVPTPKQESWKPLHEDFAEAVGLVHTCAATDASEFSLTYVHITPEYIEATDRLQFARYSVPFPTSKSILTKPASIQHVKDLGATQVAVTKSWVHFNNPNGLTLACRRYLDEYPRLDEKIKVKITKGTPVTLPKSLELAAECANVFSSEDADNNHVVVLIKPGKLRITGSGSLGDHTEWKTIKYQGKTFEFAIHPNLIIDLVKKHNDCLIESNRLGVDAGKFTYITSLRSPGDINNKESDGDHDSD